MSDKWSVVETSVGTSAGETRQVFGLGWGFVLLASVLMLAGSGEWVSALLVLCLMPVVSSVRK